MDWIKILTRHTLFTPLSDAELGVLVRIQSLTAHIERMPSEAEILQITTNKKLECIENKLNLSGICIEFVLKKVLEDVQKVSKERDRLKEYRSKVKEKNKKRTRTVQGREEKRREEKSIYNIYIDYEKQFLDVVSKWIQYRNDIKKPLKSQSTIEGQIKKLFKLSSGNSEIAEKIVERSITEGWQGLFKLKQKGEKHNAKQPTGGISREEFEAGLENR